MELKQQSYTQWLNSLKWLLLLAITLLTLTWMIKLGQEIATVFQPVEVEAQVIADATTTPASPTPTASVETATPMPAPPTPTPAPPTPTPEPSYPYLNTGNNTVNVRSGPDTAYEKIGLLLPGETAIVTGWSGAWWQIDRNGAPGFVLGELVTARNVAGLPEVAAPPLPTPTAAPLPTPEPAPAWAADEARWIDVDLSEQLLTAYEWQTPVKSYLVSTGLPQTPTPVGQYRIWIKLKTDDMSGADYYIPDVPWVMYFFGGYGLHGVTWHANFGHPMSHGCVNQPNDMAEWLFAFAEVGTLVNIHE